MLEANKESDMLNVQILEPHDVMMADDLVRQLAVVFDGQSDGFMETSTYGGYRINRMGWIKVSEMLPAWVGRTMDDYNSSGVTRLGQFEVIRGDVPDGHMEDDVLSYHY